MATAHGICCALAMTWTGAPSSSCLPPRSAPQPAQSTNHKIRMQMGGVIAPASYRYNRIMRMLWALGMVSVLGASANAQELSNVPELEDKQAEILRQQKQRADMLHHEGRYY